MTKETKKQSESTTTNNKTKEESAVTPASKTSAQPIVIAVLSTVLICAILAVVILFATGTIRISGGNSTGNSATTDAGSTGGNAPKNEQKNDTTPAGTTVGGVTCYDDTRVQVGNLEFCLPDDFKYGATSGGVYSYNLVDDDGWAEVKVYAEKTSQTPTQFITNLSSNLKVTNQNYTLNGATWVRAEAGDYMLALSTRKGELVYTIFFTVKLDSDDTREAWNKILTTPVFVEQN